MCAFISGIERKTLAQVESLAAMSPSALKSITCDPTEAGHSHSHFSSFREVQGTCAPMAPIETDRGFESVLKPEGVEL